MGDISLRSTDFLHVPCAVRKNGNSFVVTKKIEDKPWGNDSKTCWNTPSQLFEFLEEMLLHAHGITVTHQQQSVDALKAWQDHEFVKWQRVMGVLWQAGIVTGIVNDMLRDTHNALTLGLTQLPLACCLQCVTNLPLALGWSVVSWTTHELKCHVKLSGSSC